MRPVEPVRALSLTRSPRVPPETMLGLNGRRRTVGVAPNIVKDGTPQIALSAASHRRRTADPGGNPHPLTPQVPQAPARLTSPLNSRLGG
jgi:hypothetical protein